MGITRGGRKGDQCYQKYNLIQDCIPSARKRQKLIMIYVIPKIIPLNNATHTKTPATLQKLCPPKMLPVKKVTLQKHNLSKTLLTLVRHIPVCPRKCPTARNVVFAPLPLARGFSRCYPSSRKPENSVYFSRVL